MGYVFMTSPCVNCQKIISFNPNKVPSLIIDGKREPLCKGCFYKWKKYHKSDIKINPQAYEPDDENKIKW